MDNTYESNIEAMMTELELFKESAVPTDISDLPRSQINIECMDSAKAVIQINLKTNESNESPICDEPDISDDKNSPDNSGCNSGRTEPDKSHSGAKDADEESDNNTDTGTNSDQTIKGRSSRRTISESTNEDSTKGILKYSHSWIRRTVSESNCDSVDIDLELLSLFWHSVEDIDSDDDMYSEKKPKKNVRFSDNVSKTVFRPNSSILGRKLKNQKRKAKKNTNKKNNNNPTGSTKSEYKDVEYPSERCRQDSGYDSEDGVSCRKSALIANKPFEIETGIKQLSI